jgi:hypothetical protein
MTSVSSPYFFSNTGLDVMIHTEIPAFVAYILQLIISPVITSRVLFHDWTCALMELRGLGCNYL